MRLVFRFLFFLVLASSLRAATVGEIRSQIDNHSTVIKKLETQIDAYQKDLKATEKTSKNLQSEIVRLETTRKKLEVEIKITGEQISKTDLIIDELSLQIGDKKEILARRRAAVAESLREWRILDNQTLLEVLFRYDNLSDAWNEVSQLGAFGRNLKQNIENVSKLKTELEDNKQETETERQNLATLKNRLADQKEIAQENQIDKDRLLTSTKNKESNYKKLLTETIARKEAFEQELFSLESALRIAIDFKELPPAGAGVLKWPLEKIFITQKFGKTVDSKRLYTSGTHNGIDLRASVGTPVFAVRTGIVKGVGDTDTVCRGVSYGKWVLIEHANGLSTLYGHLSLIKAVPGQNVNTGEILGYSGNTGYSTGPHLHLTVYATQGVRIDNYNFKSCAGAKIRIPLADPQAYLDPLIYL